MLTLEQLKAMKPNSIFASGITPDNVNGISMSDSGNELRWVAVRGGIHDWAIYTHLSEKSIEWVKAHGDKVHYSKHIRKLVHCDDEAFAMYRH